MNRFLSNIGTRKQSIRIERSTLNIGQGGSGTRPKRIWLMKDYRQLHHRTRHRMEIHLLIFSPQPFSISFVDAISPCSLSMTRSNMRTRCMLACTGTLRARRPCQRSRRRRSCSDHGVGIVGDGGQSSTTTTTMKTSTNQNCYGKHIYRLLSTYCRTKDLYASMGP